MSREDYLKEKVGDESPFRVPDNYFEDVVQQIEAQLPEFPAPQKAEPLSRWHRIRPYVYLAAMFCGIWCMMKIFHTATGLQSPLEAPAEHIAMVMESPEEYGVAMVSSSQDDFALEMEVLDAYDSADDFRADLMDD